MRVHIHTYTDTHIHTYIDISTHTYIYVHIHIYVRTYKVKKFYDMIRTNVLGRSRLQGVGPVGVADGALALLGARLAQHGVLAR